MRMAAAADAMGIRLTAASCPARRPDRGIGRGWLMCPAQPIRRAPLPSLASQLEPEPCVGADAQKNTATAVRGDKLAATSHPKG